MPLRGHYESLWVHYQANQRIKCTSMSNIKHRGVQTWKRLNSKCVTKRLIKLHLSLNRNWILKVNESDFHGSNLCTGLIYSWPPATPISNLWTASCRPQKVGYKWKPPRHRHRTAGILFAYTHTHTLTLPRTGAKIQTRVRSYVCTYFPGARVLFKANISHLALRLNKFSMNTLKLFLWRLTFTPMQIKVGDLQARI